MSSLFGKDFFSEWLLDEFCVYDGEIISYNFLGLVTEEQKDNIKLHSGAKELVLIDNKSKIKSIKSQYDKKDVVLFEDQFEILQELFQTNYFK